MIRELILAGLILALVAIEVMAALRSRTLEAALKADKDA